MNDFQVKTFLKFRIRHANPFALIQFDNELEEEEQKKAIKEWIPDAVLSRKIAAGRPENQAIVNIYGNALTALRANPANYQAIIAGLNPDALPSLSQTERDELRKFKVNPKSYFKDRLIHMGALGSDPRLYA